MERASAVSAEEPAPAVLTPEEIEHLAEEARLEMKRGDLDRAIAMLEELATRAPDSAPTYIRLGVTLRYRGDLIHSRNAFRRAAELRPDLAEAHHGLGSVISAIGNPNDALGPLMRAVEADPRNAEALNDLGGAFTAVGRFEEAIRAFELAAELRPQWSVPLHNMAVAVKRTGDVTRARQLMQRAVETDTPQWLSHLELGAQHLGDGRFEEGWRSYEWRGKNGGKPVWRPDLEAPVWDGSALGDRTLLLWSEQGLGDLLQFVRFAALIPKGKGQVVLYAPAPVASVVATCPGIDRVVVDGETLQIDLQFPVMSLPWLLNEVPKPIPPYLSAPDECADAEAAIQPGTAFNVGIVWASGRAYPCHGWRDCPLELFAPLAEIPEVRLFSLQYGDAVPELAESPIPIIDLSPVLGDFHKTAAFVKRLDLIITVDTSLAHLAGAVGAPVWTLIPHAPDWRWMQDESTTPWYATMRLYRQRIHGDWRPEMERIEHDLRTLTAGRFPSAPPLPPRQVVRSPKTEPRLFVKQYGEPGTGTNYLRALTLANYADTEVLIHILGDKHAPPVPFEELRREAAAYTDPALAFVLRATFGQPGADTKPWIQDQGNEIRRVANGVLQAYDRAELRYLISIKDPYDWMVGLARQNRIILGTMPLPERLDELLAKLCRRFNRLYAAWLALADAHPEQTAVMRYEDAIRDSAAAFADIEKKFGLPRRSPQWNAVTGRVRHAQWDGWPVSVSNEPFDREYHLQRRYLDSIPSRYRRIISETIDWSRIARFGYQPLHE